MTLRDDITSDLDDVFFDEDEFAQSVTYNGTPIDALVEYGVDPTEGVSASSEARLIIKASDVTKPTYRDAVVIDGTLYHVQQVLKGDSYIWTVSIETNERPRPR